jgi:hypothetical protein
MNLYGPKQLADSMRVVRKNTIAIAEDIPEEHYSYRPAPESRSVRETLLHMWAMLQFDLRIQATHPHFAYAPHAAPQALHNSGRLKWGSGPRDGVPAYTGEDVIIVRDGKIAALYVFLDAPPA